MRIGRVLSQSCEAVEKKSELEKKILSLLKAMELKLKLSVENTDRRFHSSCKGTIKCDGFFENVGVGIDVMRSS